MENKRLDSIKVLLVDDNTIQADIVGNFLANKPDSPFQIVKAELGSEGMRLLELEQPDIILLDFLLPDMSGLEFYKRCRLHSEHQCPVIMLTGTGNYEVATEAMRMGVDGYLVKGEVHFKMGEMIQNALDNFKHKSSGPLRTINVALLIDASPISQAVSRILEPFLTFEPTRFDTFEAIMAHSPNTGQSIDLILTDYQPVFDDSRLEKLIEAFPSAAVVVVSKIQNERQVAQAFEIGIHDMVRYGSSRFKNLPDVIRAAVAEHKVRLLSR